MATTASIASAKSLVMELTMNQSSVIVAFEAIVRTIFDFNLFSSSPFKPIMSNNNNEAEMLKSITRSIYDATGFQASATPESNGQSYKITIFASDSSTVRMTDVYNLFGIISLMYGRRGKGTSEIEVILNGNDYNRNLLSKRASDMYKAKYLSRYTRGNPLTSNQQLFDYGGIIVFSSTLWVPFMFNNDGISDDLKRRFPSLQTSEQALCEVLLKIVDIACSSSSARYKFEKDVFGYDVVNYGRAIFLQFTMTANGYDWFNDLIDGNDTRLPNGNVLWSICACMIDAPNANHLASDGLTSLLKKLIKQRNVDEYTTNVDCTIMNDICFVCRTQGQTIDEETNMARNCVKPLACDHIVHDACLFSYLNSLGPNAKLLCPLCNTKYYTKNEWAKRAVKS